ncbi:hypothetical protein SLEP1_g46815 [Rubroshorea leprosula]|uniref:Uncharacterized protein n=1 Tax=Rubroshorea leprosula TaxID=152421 RepID=A0AAV5LP99_9ROSI|nr:hypothetical protein SLEP1_g46815 [Rubroshorea leprosula]
MREEAMYDEMLRMMGDTERGTDCTSVSSASEEEAVFVQEEEGATEGQTFPAT